MTNPGRSLLGKLHSELLHSELQPCQKWHTTPDDVAVDAVDAVDAVVPPVDLQPPK